MWVVKSIALGRNEQRLGSKRPGRIDKARNDGTKRQWLVTTKLETTCTRRKPPVRDPRRKSLLYGATYLVPRAGIERTSCTDIGYKKLAQGYQQSRSNFR
jgi:hypothetical protein